MKKCFNLFIFYLLGIIQLFSQVNLISAYPPASSLSGSALSTYQTISAFPKFISVQLVQLNNLVASVNEDGNLQIDLTSDDCGILEFEPRNSRFINEQDYYYYGTLKPPSDTCQCTCIDGEIMIESREGRKFGYIVIDDTKYELLALNSDYSVLGKINTTFFSTKQECVASGNSEGEGLTVPEYQLSPRTSGCAIRVLFLFTQNAEDAFGLGGINDMANLAISQTNQAFSNSAITNTCVVRANIRKWVGFVETPGDFDGDLFDLRTSNQVANWRNTDLADVVILITNAGYDGGILGGVPIQNLGNPQNAFAFGAIEGSSITANFTFSHELGHIIGCRHQRCETFQNGGCDDNGPFEHGSGWGQRKCWLCSWKNYSTILHQLRYNNTRILYYSNPDINYKDKPTGIVNSRDNARWIRGGHACAVAGYRADPFIPLSASIIGNEILCRPLSDEYFADVAGSNGPFSYDWNISTDGINWGNSVGTSQSIWVNSNNYPLKSTVFLRVRVQNILGNFVFAFFKISIQKKGTPGCDFQLLTSGNNGSEVSVYPNPINETLSIEFLIPEDNTEASFELQDCFGKSISRISKIYQKGIQNESINTNNIGNGILMLNTIINGKLQTVKVLKIE